MTKAQLLFDPTAECEQFGLLPRGRNDLNAERPLIRLPRRRQGEHREADQRDDEGDGKIIDRRIEAHIVDPRHVANVIVPWEDRRGRHDDELLARHQIAKASIDGRRKGAFIYEPGRFSSLCKVRGAATFNALNGGRSPGRTRG